MELPVYVFTGFLSAGKTSFLQESLEDKRFNAGERTLLLLCEEGEEEYDPSRFAGKNVFVEILDSETQLNPDKLSALTRKHKAERAIVECNGMWQMASLYNALPDEWYVCQQMTLFDATDILTYNANMRSLVVDKIANSETVVFNRCTDAMDLLEFHKLVRGISRRTDILYEFTDGRIEMDQIEDPLPFDINAPVIVIEDRDYALWYRDMLDNPEPYDGKHVRFKGIVATNKQLPKKSIFVGRHIMTCCAEDITYSGMLCKTEQASSFRDYDWITVQALIRVEKSPVYRDRGPVLYAETITPAERPEDPVATFY